MDQAASAENLDRIFTQKQAAEYLQRKPKTLEGWRAAGTGPKFLVGPTGRFAGYRLSALNAWLERQEVSSTAEARMRATEEPQRRPSRRQAGG